MLENDLIDILFMEKELKSEIIDEIEEKSQYGSFSLKKQQNVGKKYPTNIPVKWKGAHYPVG